MAFTSSAKGKSGSARMREIAIENAAEVEKITGELIVGLGRPAIGSERIAAETIARTIVRSRRLASTGRDDLPERRLLSRLMVTTPFGMVPAPPPAERQHGKAVADAIDRHDRDRMEGQNVTP